jgi:phosphoglycolate phosphatase-like HAD superfamily hydrolase
MTKSFVVFDLDGTLIDGYGAIGDALAYAMERLGCRPSSGEGARARRTAIDGAPERSRA